MDSKLYNGRNKTFFMFGWKSLRNKVQIPGVESVLSEKMRNGDFSEVSTQIVNPVTKAPYAGNIIPRSELSTQALAALQ